MIYLKFAIGYQLRKNNTFVDMICENSNKVYETYFSIPGFANGRNSNIELPLTDYEYQGLLEKDLHRLSQNNISLNLLLNAECYGKYALSRIFFNKIGDTVDYLVSHYNLKSVTTTSPLIAKFLKENFLEIEVRASVNMEIGTTEGIEYLAEFFDSFYAKRECNRDFKKLKKLRSWCDNNGKKLYGLANSGCLNYCSAHTFHDNLVAHENEIAEMDNAYQFEGQCRMFLKDTLNREKWLSVSNFIRPEDIHLYEDFFDGIKLATRVNKNPEKILEAYIKGSYNGNLPSLLEPDHSALFYPNVVDNKKIADDFAVKTATCDKNCDACGYCKKVLSDSLICLE